MISKLSAAASNSMHPDVPTDEIVLGYRNLPLLADYLRGWAGIVLAALPLVMMRPSWPVGLGLVCLIGLFAIFLIQTWRRQHSTVILGPAGVAVIDQGEHRLARQHLDGLRLRWFGSRTSGRGWLELELRGGDVRLVVSSALDRFDAVVAEAVQAANDRGIALEPATLANVEALLRRAA